LRNSLGTRPHYDADQITGMGLYDGQQTAFLMTDPSDIADIPERARA
jgi:hypothetical protein